MAPNLSLGTVKNALHYHRWKRIKDGASIEKVAEEDHVKPRTIQNSYLLIETRKNLFSMPVLETSTVEMIMSLRQEEEESLRAAFKAKHRDFHETPNGTVVVEEVDHDTALSASSRITERIAALQSRKGGGFNINMQQNATANASSGGGDGKMSFESKLREVLQRRKEQRVEVEAIDVPALPAGDDDGDVDEDSA